MRLTGDQKISKKMQKKFGFFKIFPHAGTVEENTWHFEVLLLFLSLRYGADLGRSRLVSFFLFFKYEAAFCEGKCINKHSMLADSRQKVTLNKTF